MLTLLLLALGQKIPGSAHLGDQLEVGALSHMNRGLCEPEPPPTMARFEFWRARKSTPSRAELPPLPLMAAAASHYVLHCVLACIDDSLWEFAREVCTRAPFVDTIVKQVINSKVILTLFRHFRNISYIHTI